MLSASWAGRMKHWTFWEWIGYGALWVGAIVIAADQSLKLSSAPLRLYVSGLLESPLWGFSPLACLTVGSAILVSRHFEWIGRKERLSEIAIRPVSVSGPPAIEIRFEKRAPYEVSDVQNGHVLSTVRIGIRNVGGSALSNCRVYIEKISPPPYLPGGDGPRQLADSGFTIRWDDPEKFVDVATHWDHVNQYRFQTPQGWFAETLNFLDDSIVRTIVIKVEAFECQRSASFKISTDAEKAIHLDYIGYVA